MPGGELSSAPTTKSEVRTKARKRSHLLETKPTLQTLRQSLKMTGTNCMAAHCSVDTPGSGYALCRLTAWAVAAYQSEMKVRSHQTLHGPRTARDQVLKSQQQPALSPAPGFQLHLQRQLTSVPKAQLSPQVNRDCNHNSKDSIALLFSVLFFLRV